MFVFVIRRVLISIPVLVASTLVTFVLVKVSGDPLQYLKLRNPRPSAHTIFLAEQRLWLNRSWPAQYWHWISNVVLHDNWGPEVQGIANNVRGQIFSAFLVTARLVAASVIIALVLAVVTGVLSAVRQYSVLDYATTTAGFVFLSMPTFWFAVLLKEAGIWFNEHISANTFYTIGERNVLPDNGAWAEFRDYFGHLILPTIVLGLTGYAAWSRFTRASMLEVLNSDYVRLARAKGLAPRTVLVKHALRTALIPLATVTSLDIAGLLGGAIVTEFVFQWHGMGNLFLTSLTNLDFNIMLGWLLVTAVIVIGFNLLADLLYGVLDPRIRNA
jgi:peptide/nickel transport system permease protein